MSIYLPSFQNSKRDIFMTNTFFKDLKVIELASVLAGPAVGLFFAELGANVIKIENQKTGGDVTRIWRLPNEDKDKDYSAYYCCVNWQKEVLMLDLQSLTDRQKVYDLIQEADVVISNFKLKSATKLGMDYAQLKAINPQLIYAQLTSFGESVDRPAFDMVLQAEAGFLYMCGEPNRDPVKMPVALIDLMAAHQLKEAILLAIIHRMRTGEGTYVTTSLLEAAVASLANQATNWLMANHIPQRMGTMHPNIAPYGDIFTTKDDKPIILAVGTERQFQSLCAVLDMASLVENELYATNSQRVQNRVALKEALKPAFLQFDRADILEKLTTKGVPAGSIRNMQEVFEMPQTKEMILEQEFEDGTLTKRVKTVAFQMRP